MTKSLLYLFCILAVGCTNMRKNPTAGGTDSITNVVASTDDTATVDAPIPLSEIEKYDDRMSMQRLSNVAITYPDAYKIRTQKKVYSPEIRRIQLNVINTNAPTVLLGDHRLEQWVGGKWITFPFIENLSFAGVGRSVSEGDTLPEYINMNEFKYPLKPNRYKAHFSVLADIYTYCTLTEQGIYPVKGSKIKGAFDFRVLKSNKDSIYIVFENHTNLLMQPRFFPSIGTDSLYSVHPLARSGWNGEREWMEKHSSLKGGGAIMFSIPTSWDIKRLGNSSEKDKYKLGRLLPGKYKIGLQVEIYMNTEFEVKRGIQ